MNVSSWLWSWLDAPPLEPSSLDGFDHAAKLSLRKLEDRQVLSVTTMFPGGVLDILLADDGSSDDVSLIATGGVVQLSVDGGMTYQNVDGNDAMIGPQDLSASAVTTIQVHSSDGGQNSINLSGVIGGAGNFTSLAIVSIDAGAGADTIVGSAFADTIYGGDGDRKSTRLNSSHQ